jgi:hypothetical protein
MAGVRPTLENIAGGFILFADKPGRVGEFCLFSDKKGTVAEISLRLAEAEVRTLRADGTLPTRRGSRRWMAAWTSRPRGPASTASRREKSARARSRWGAWRSRSTDNR